MPFRANQARRHRIPRQRHRVTDWPAYDAAPRARGGLAAWFGAEATAARRAEPRATRGGQPRYPDLAIATALAPRAVSHLAPRQAEGLVGSIPRLLGLGLAVPDHGATSRRARTLEVVRPRPGSRPVHLLVDSAGLRPCGPGERLAGRHGARTRRLRHELRLAVDADTGRIVAAGPTGHDADDGGQVHALPDQHGGPTASPTADGAYGGADVHAAVAARARRAAAVVPPRSSAVLGAAEDATPARRDGHIAAIAAHRRVGWQRRPGYSRRALVEAGVSRWKRVVGDWLRSRTADRRSTEVAIAANVLDRMLGLGRPEYVRVA